MKLESKRIKYQDKKWLTDKHTEFVKAINKGAVVEFDFEGAANF